jgi:hypothetical protein
MENLNHACIDAVEDFVPVPPDDFDTDRRVGRHARAQWIMCNIVDGRVNGVDNIPGTSGASLIKILENAIEIGKRQFPITYLHAEP